MNLLNMRVILLICKGEKMKKIDIITFQNAHNYGATLQTYALQRFLNYKNYDANDINYKDKAIGDQYKIFRVNTKNE